MDCLVRGLDTAFLAVVDKGVSLAFNLHLQIRESVRYLALDVNPSLTVFVFALDPFKAILKGRQLAAEGTVVTLLELGRTLETEGNILPAGSFAPREWELFVS